MRPKGTAAELEQRRRQAIALLQEGKTQVAVAKALDTSEASVSRWRQAYEHNGETALAAKPHPGKPLRLTARPRYHVHDTPTYSSWLNPVEIWFNLITQQAIRRGSFRSVRQLTQRIDDFVKRYNPHCAPFVWTATAGSILAKIERLCTRISGTAH